jgi:excisionase family DNA binding protein
MDNDVRAHEITSLLHRLGELLADRPSAGQSIPEQRQSTSRTLLTVEEAAERLGISRTRTYALIGTNELESVQIGRLRRVPVSAIADYATRLLTNKRAA